MACGLSATRRVRVHFDLDEVGEDGSWEGRIVKLHRVVLGIFLRGAPYSEATRRNAPDVTPGSLVNDFVTALLLCDSAPAAAKPNFRRP
jgi:hypothetical protein